MQKKATAGNRGEGVSSDCYVELELTANGGIKLELKSKVESLFGEKIKAFCFHVLHYFNIENAQIYIEDTGALDYVLAARIETAIKQLMDTDKEFLLEMLPQNKVETQRDKHRRSRLYLPGNAPKLALNAGVYGADGIILDLEDSVAADKKFEAAILVRNALRNVDFYNTERMVRINQMPKGLDDLDFVVPHFVNLLLVPKCENADQIVQINSRIREIMEQHGMEHPVHLMPILESAKGVMNAMEIAQADNVVALAIGLEDYTADLGVQRTDEGTESFFARCQLVNAASAAGIQAIDSVFSDFSDMEKLRKVVLESKTLGFNGMGCIHPRQIKVIHENYAPNDAEIETAKKIVNAFHLATEKGLGVVSLGSKMIDPPVVKRAQTTIDLAIAVGKLNQTWRDNYVG
ncbi:MAG: aldolase/citrate lyase family protein [Desulfuromusa sp.]|jgi:citrate lyase subunit beta/citryl-CoA lyase|nr:aldolase/citrate lyase family protein [Desulfuromusa sp.]